MSSQGTQSVASQRKTSAWFFNTSYLFRVEGANECDEQIIRKFAVGGKGGEFALPGCKVTFPPGAVEKEEEFCMSVVDDPDHYPEHLLPVAPMMRFRGNAILKSAITVELDFWSEVANEKGLEGIGIFTRASDGEFSPQTDFLIGQHGKVTFATDQLIDVIVAFPVPTVMGGPSIINVDLDLVKVLGPIAKKAWSAFKRFLFRRGMLGLIVLNYLTHDHYGTISNVLCFDAPQYRKEQEATQKSFENQPIQEKVTGKDVFEIRYFARQPDKPFLGPTPDLQRSYSQTVRALDVLENGKIVSMCEMNGLQNYAGEIAVNYEFGKGNGEKRNYPIKFHWPVGKY